MNTSKTEAMPQNIPVNNIKLLNSNFHFYGIDSSVKYLGVKLTSSYSRNILPLFRDVHQLLKKWKSLQSSLFGCISIWPYCPSCFAVLLLIRVPLSELKPFQAAIFNFVWNSKWIRIPKLVMLSGKLYEGLPSLDWKVMVSSYLPYFSFC